MKTHLLRPGAVASKDGTHSATRCGTNKAGVVPVSNNMAEVDCGRCQQLRLRDASSTTTVGIVAPPKETFEEKFELGSVVHFGEDDMMCDPDETTFCNSRVGRTAIAFETSREGEVTCKRCKAKMSSGV